MTILAGTNPFSRMPLVATVAHSIRYKWYLILKINYFDRNLHGFANFFFFLLPSLGIRETPDD